MSESPYGPPIWIDQQTLDWIQRRADEAGHGDPGRFAGEVLMDARAADEGTAPPADPWEPLEERLQRHHGDSAT